MSSGYAALRKTEKYMKVPKKFSNEAPRLAIVLPCFNEFDSITYAVTELGMVVDQLIADKLVADNSYLFFVDDGSTDCTWSEIERFHQKGSQVKGLKLAKNFGHQAALLAGLNSVNSQCDAAISLDVDLQQDPLAIRDFIKAFCSGADVVLGVRRDRNTDSWFKRLTATFFYKLMKVMGVNTVPNHADNRLLSQRALKALDLFSEPNIFLRAICLQLGFRTSQVMFDVKERQYGRTKYSLAKMLGLALTGVTSFSIVPLRLVAIVGMGLFVLSLGMSAYVFWQSLVIGGTVPGWASTTLPIYFIGGVQLLCLGVVGEYVGQIYATVKSRPRWISEQLLD